MMKTDSEESKMHQLHITIPTLLQEELKKALPEYGQVTTLVRNFLQGFVRNYNNMSSHTESPFDKTMKEVTEKTLLKRSSGGDGVAGD